MAHSTSYEINVKQKGRWEIHARYTASEKDAAIEEAKTLDKMKHVEAVKVIQEIYDLDDGTSKEYNVYAPGQKKYQPPRKSSKKSSGSSSEDSGNKSSAKSRKKPVEKQTFSALILRILAITVFATIVGGLFTWFLSMVMADTTIAKNAQINILILTFLITFVMGAIPMAIIFLGTKSTRKG